MSEGKQIFSQDQSFFAKKSLGQHFLHNENIVDKIVEAGEISGDDTILEIGPGLGVLTKKLVLSPAKQVILCEKDDQLFEIIKNKYSSGKTKIIKQDALALIPSLQVNEPFKVISNLPYNISSPVIISMLSVCPTLPHKMVLMIQKEVADRLTAKPGDSNRGWMTVLLELMSQTKIVTNVSKHNFNPPPRVESSVISINDIHQIDEFSPKQAIRVLKAGFAGKRKKLLNSIFRFYKISPEDTQTIAQRHGINLDDRAEDLDDNSWRNLIIEMKRRGLV